MAQGLYDITPLEPFIAEGCTLLTPNSRMTRRIKAEWDARRVAAGDRVWQPLAVQPLEKWLLDQWNLALRLELVPPVTPLGPGQALEVWRQVIREHEGQSSAYQLLRPSAAAELANEARDTLRRWQVDVSSAGFRQAFALEPDCETFLRWLALFEQRLTAKRQCTAVDCLAQLAGLGGRLPPARVVLVDMEDIPPLLNAALEALAAQVHQYRPVSVSQPCLAHSFSDQRTELQAVAAWAAALHRSAPATTIGIVLSDMAGSRAALEYLLRREFDCLGENYNSLPVNFSTGIALGQAPLARDALSLLDMALQYTSVATVVRLLHSRYVDLPDAQGALAQRFITRLHARGGAELAISDLRTDAATVTLGQERGLVLAQHLRALHNMRDLRRQAGPSLWVERFNRVLDVWGWPGNQSLDSLEYQQLDLWHRTLDEFRAFDAVCGTINLADALRLLRECCNRQIFQPQTADSPIQVLGPLEAAGLAFEHLWLCGMQAASWPAPPRPNPFIPVALQAQRQMPHASPEREWAFSEALLARYMRCCKTLHASYARQVDGVPDTASALIDDFIQEDIAEPPLIPASWTDTYRAARLEEVPDHKAPAVNITQFATTTGGSRLVEDQSQCPFRAFARHRLLVEPLPESSVGLSAAERGSILHAALFALWGEIGDHASLAAMDTMQQEAVVLRAAAAAITAATDKQSGIPAGAYWRLEQQRLAALLREWLLVERQRVAFAVVQREHDVTFALAQLQIRLRVDRVDELQDGSRIIIDYKSGASRVQDWLGDRPASPQLLLYGIAQPESVAALAFAQVRPRDCRYTGLGQVAAAPGISTDIPRAVSARMDATDWSSLQARWRANLERLANEFVAGEAAVDPLTPASCTWCGLQSLCRIARIEDTREAQGE